MNESTLMQLKIVVERAVRPVRASAYRKRKIREELLAHVTSVFEEEFARLADHQAALQRTALRFGNPVEITVQLQESVRASDRIMRFLEGRPDRSPVRAALLFSWIEGSISTVALAVALCAAGWTSAWSPDEFSRLLLSFGFLPFWLCMPLWLLGVILSTCLMEKSLHGPEPLPGWPWVGILKLLSAAWAVVPVRLALIVASVCLLLLAYTGCPTWPARPSDWVQSSVPGVCLLAMAMAASSVLFAWILVQTVSERRRCHEEWSRLPLEPSA